MRAQVLPDSFHTPQRIGPVELAKWVGSLDAWIGTETERSAVCHATGRVPVIETENPSLRYFRSDYDRAAPRSAYQKLLVQLK
jgi:hypothetical protein